MILFTFQGLHFWSPSAPQWQARAGLPREGEAGQLALHGLFPGPRAPRLGTVGLHSSRLEARSAKPLRIAAEVVSVPNILVLVWMLWLLKLQAEGEEPKRERKGRLAQARSSQKEAPSRVILGTQKARSLTRSSESYSTSRSDIPGPRSKAETDRASAALTRARAWLALSWSTFAVHAFLTFPFLPLISSLTATTVFIRQS